MIAYLPTPILIATKKATETKQVKKRKRAVDYKTFLNPDSLTIVKGFTEPSMATVKAADQFQFMRLGYFCVDADSSPQNRVFNRVVALKDSWSKISNRN
jgi:glutaminyl-tRNA synthetase